jgi:hypothetical protein
MAGDCGSGGLCRRTGRHRGGSTDRKTCIWDVATGHLETLEMLDSVTGLTVSASHLAAALGTAVAVFSVRHSALAATSA